jgi:hypothetical protein
MTLIQARYKARKYSRQYNTFWYVRQVDGDFEPWAHDTEDGSIVATFYLGNEWTE